MGISGGELRRRCNKILEIRWHLGGKQGQRAGNAMISMSSPWATSGQALVVVLIALLSHSVIFKSLVLAYVVLP